MFFSKVISKTRFKGVFNMKILFGGQFVPKRCIRDLEVLDDV